MTTTTTIKATSDGNFTVPKQLRKVAGITEEGQVLTVKVYANKRIVIEPIDFKYDENRAQKATKKAAENIRKGNILEFNSTKDAIDYLES